MCMAPLCHYICHGYTGESEMFRQRQPTSCRFVWSCSQPRWTLSGISAWPHVKRHCIASPTVCLLGVCQICESRCSNTSRAPVEGVGRRDIVATKFGPTERYTDGRTSSKVAFASSRTTLPQDRPTMQSLTALRSQDKTSQICATGEQT